MDKVAKEIRELAEYGALHNEDCCVNFPEDSRACDVGTPTLGCCENMKALASFAENLVEVTVGFLVHDMEFQDHEQREAAIKLYMEDLKEKVIE